MQFQDFPNLEVVWLNNNNLKTLDPIRTNFRIKHVYCINNQLVNVDAVKKLKFLETLILSNNQLEGVNKFLDITASNHAHVGLDKNNNVSKNFAFLLKLDLQDNPLASEPYYRLRMIKAIPSLRILDQKMITMDERTKAAKIDLALGYVPDTKSGKKAKRGHKNVTKGFSKGEKLLYNEVERINKEKFKDEKLEETKKQEETLLNFTIVKPETLPPTANKVLENKEKFGKDTEDKVTEWEINTVKKLFKDYDTDKSGYLSVEELQKLMRDLIDDKLNIGKVPRLSDDEITHLFDTWDKNDDGKISWQEFRDGINSWQWKLMDKQERERRIEKYFEEANRKKVQGDLKGALKIAYNALALQGCDTKTQPIEVKKPTSKPKVKRGDVFTIPMFRNVKSKVKEVTSYVSK